MKYLKSLGVLAMFGMFFLIPAAPAQAQGFSVGVGAGPGYYGAHRELPLWLLLVLSVCMRTIWLLRLGMV